MKKMTTLLSTCPLFNGIREDEWDELMTCLNAKQKHFAKGDFIVLSGDQVTDVGVVIKGQVLLVQEDFWGDRTILDSIEEGGIFGESFSWLETDKVPISAYAKVDSDILFINYRRIVTTCHASCIFHARLIDNMMSILAQGNIFLTKKMRLLTQRSTRNKLLSYLSEQSHKEGSPEFDIPFNRQELAEYLSVDRSAMSRELSRLRQEGILDFKRSHFILLKRYNLRRKNRL